MADVLALAVFGALVAYSLYSLIAFLRRAKGRLALARKYTKGFSLDGLVYFSDGRSNDEPELETEDWDLFLGSRARPTGSYDEEGAFTPIVYDWRIGNSSPGSHGY